MKKIFILTTILSIAFTSSFAQEKVLHIHEKSYNDDGKIIDTHGKLYSGKAKEKLKGEGYLIGEVNKGDISGKWGFYEHNKITGYHHYLSNGDTTFSYDLKGKLLWVDVFQKNKEFSIYLDEKQEIKFLKSNTYDNKDAKTNMFDFQIYEENHFQSTLSDYDYKSDVVIDYFESKAGEQEIIIKKLSNSKELVKIICDKHKVKEVYLVEDILENPEDADYKLDEHFDISFTEVKNHENFSIHLIKDKKIIFDASIVDGEILVVDKYISETERFIIYDKKEGYAPSEHKIANELISVLEKKKK